jgi:hypothetical protein
MVDTQAAGPAKPPELPSDTRDLIRSYIFRTVAPYFAGAVTLAGLVGWLFSAYVHTNVKEDVFTEALAKQAVVLESTNQTLREVGRLKDRYEEAVEVASAASAKASAAASEASGLLSDLQAKMAKIVESLLADPSFKADVVTIAQAASSKQIAYFRQENCPTGWKVVGDMAGLYIVGWQPGEKIGSVVGNALGPDEMRATGKHAHSVPGMNLSSCQPSLNVQTGDCVKGDHGLGVVGGISSSDAGAVDGTNAPYIALLACEHL